MGAAQQRSGSNQHGCEQGMAVGVPGIGLLLQGGAQAGLGAHSPHHCSGKPPGPMAFHFHTLTRPCSSPENTSCAAAEPAMARALFTSPSVPRACGREREKCQGPLGGRACSQTWRQTSAQHFPAGLLRPTRQAGPLRACAPPRKTVAPTGVCSARHCSWPSARSDSRSRAEGGRG